MTDFTSVTMRYLQIWNEENADARAALIGDLFTPDASYTDPMAAVTGSLALNDLIGSARQQFPGMGFRLHGEVDGHHDQLRFRWALGPHDDADPLVIGFDVVTLDEAGRITGVLGFLDLVPGGTAPATVPSVGGRRAFAVAKLDEVRMGEDIVAYLDAIDSTLTPFGGRFVIHGDTPTVLEGEWSGDLIVIEFPDRRNAEDWYGSDAYQHILPLRTVNAWGSVILVDGVSPDHRAVDVLR